MKFVKYESDDEFLLMQVVSEVNLEDINAVSVEFSQYFSNYHNDNQNTSKVIFARSAHSCLTEITENEFKDFVQEKLSENQEELDSVIPGDSVQLYLGRLKPRTILKF